MTDLQPTTTATGGRSAKVVALAALVVLAGVIYVGATGSSSSAPAASGTPAASFAVAEASVVPPATPLIDEPTGVVVPVIDRSKPPQYQYLGMALDIAGQQFTGPMSEDAPGVFRGAYRIRLPLPAPVAMLAIGATQSTVSHDAVEPIEQWRIPLTATSGSGGDPKVVFRARELPTERETFDPLAARVISAGFDITAQVDTQPDVALLTIVLATLPPPTYPIASYSLTTHVQGQDVTINFHELRPGQLIAATIVPDSIRNRRLTFHLVVTPTLRPGMQPITVTPISLSVSNPESFAPDSTALSVSADPNILNADGLRAAGYTLTGATRLASGQRLIDFTLAIDPVYGEPASAD